MHQTEMESCIDSIQSMLDTLRKQVTTVERLETRASEGSNRMEELEKRVASLKMENARLNEYVSTLEDRHSLHGRNECAKAVRVESHGRAFVRK